MTKTASIGDSVNRCPGRHFLPLLISIALVIWNAPAMAAPDIVNHPELEKLFDQNGVTGAFVMLDVGKQQLHVVNPDRMDKRRYPASTFKIANSLIALETGAVTDENEIIPYGGRPQPIKSWERDMSMRDAIKVSNVPVFQELARRVGLETYEAWLGKLEYGNQTTGDNVERFWLDGPLAISPLEQVNFVVKLARGELPASARNQDIVRDMLLLESGESGQLFGKGGWSLAAEPQIGWWVGWVERDEAFHAFALTIDIDTSADAGKRVPLGKALLDALGAYD